MGRTPSSRRRSCACTPPAAVRQRWNSGDVSPWRCRSPGTCLHSPHEGKCGWVGEGSGCAASNLADVSKQHEGRLTSSALCRRFFLSVVISSAVQPANDQCQSGSDEAAGSLPAAGPAAAQPAPPSGRTAGVTRAAQGAVARHSDGGVGGGEDSGTTVGTAHAVGVSWRRQQLVTRTGQVSTS